MSAKNPKKERLMELWPWMTNKNWDALVLLSRIPPFDKPNIIEHMTNHYSEWEKYIQHNDDHANPLLPGPFGHFKTNSKGTKSAK